MAHEKSAPNTRTILIAAIISVVTLGLLDMGLKSYYIIMFEDEEERKVLHVPTTQLNKLREAEQQRLGAGAIPIDKAMRDLAARGLDNSTPRKIGNVDLVPESSNEQAPMVGWGLLAKDAGPSHATATEDAGAAVDPALLLGSGDGGVSNEARISDAAPGKLADAHAVIVGDAAAAPAHAMPAPAGDAGAGHEGHH